MKLALFFFIGILLYIYNYLRDTFHDNGEQLQYADLFVSLDNRSLYFNSSGSFLLNSEEISDDFLSSNNLVFGFDLDRVPDIVLSFATFNWKCGWFFLVARQETDTIQWD